MSNLDKITLLTNKSLESSATSTEEIYKDIDKLYEQNKRSR